MKYNSNKTLSSKAIRERLVDIIDHTVSNVFAKRRQNSKDSAYINQSLLEQWISILEDIICFKQNQQEKYKSSPNDFNLKDTLSLPKLKLKKSTQTKIPNSSCLLDIKFNTIDIYQINHQQSTEKRLQYTIRQIKFQKGMVRKFCSYNFSNNDNAVLIGGSRQSNPLLKVRDITNLKISSGELKKISQLPEGVSSHSSIMIDDNIFIVGGNKDMNIVTKVCYSFNLITKDVTKIASLNYASASHSLLLWKKQYIYKIGGFGYCFGDWDLSPYIERYSLLQNTWELINPILMINENLIDNYNLLTQALAYVNEQNSIVILGGLDLNGKGSNKVCEINVIEVLNENNEKEVRHEMVELGIAEKVLPGGFCSQQHLQIDGCIYTVQTINENGILNERLLCINPNVIYQ